MNNVQVYQHTYNYLHIYFKEKNIYIYMYDIKLKIRILHTTIKILMEYKQFVLFNLIIVFKFSISMFMN